MHKKSCVHCGAGFEIARENRNVTCCSPECRKARRTMHWKRADRPDRTGLPVLHEPQVQDPDSFLRVAQQIETAMPWERAALRARLTTMLEQAK